MKKENTFKVEIQALILTDGMECINRYKNPDTFSTDGFCAETKVGLFACSLLVKDWKCRFCFYMLNQRP